MTTTDQLARDGVAAIEAYFAARNASPVTAGDGRFSVYVPGGDQTETLQLALASTRAARGILARVKARRTIASSDWPKALLLANKWNRSNPVPHVVLSTRGSGDTATGHLLVEGLLTPTAGIGDDQVARFVDTVVSGARQFWSSPAVRSISAPLPTPAGAGGA